MLRAVGRRSGQVLVIEGAAGLGKSRLLQQARAAASGFGIRLLAVRATDLEQGFPYAVMRQLFERPLLEAQSGERDRLADRSGERDRWLTGAAALAADVVTSSPRRSSGLPADGSISGESYARQHGLYWSTARTRPRLPRRRSS